jgi:hypothetical protein
MAEQGIEMQPLGAAPVQTPRPSQSLSWGTVLGGVFFLVVIFLVLGFLWWFLGSNVGKNT